MDLRSLLDGNLAADKFGPVPLFTLLSFFEEDHSKYGLINDAQM